MKRGSDYVLMFLLALVASACDDPGPRSPSDESGSGSATCDRLVAQTVVIALPAEPPVELRIESCMRDVDACPQLCDFLMRGELLDPPDTCRVELRADDVVISFEYTPAGCP